MENEREWDAFVSHASEDKDYVRRLAEALLARGIRVWYDEFELTVGASLRRSIDLGLANSKFGIVVLSPAFFAKEWTQRELDALVGREVAEARALILPVWHGVTAEEIRRHSPLLADLYAVSSDRGVAHVADEIRRVITSDETVNPTPRQVRTGRWPSSITMTDEVEIIGGEHLVRVRLDALPPQEWCALFSSEWGAFAHDNNPLHIASIARANIRTYGDADNYLRTSIDLLKQPETTALAKEIRGMMFPKVYFVSDWLNIDPTTRYAFHSIWCPLCRYVMLNTNMHWSRHVAVHDYNEAMSELKHAIHHRSGEQQNRPGALDDLLPRRWDDL